MAKLLLVEDDNNLREIYGARLMAEGFEIVSAADGEEALALAVKEKPDLIISEVMMPKISGFDMLDILRTTPETKDTKVIMMTALSQPEDRARGESLGADRYLVKSQVTLEDVVATVHEVLGDGKGESTAPSPTVVNPDAIGPEDKTEVASETAPASVAPAIAEPLATPETVAPTPVPEEQPTPELVAPPVSEPEPVAPSAPPKPATAPEPAPEPASKKKKTIEPISTPSDEPDIMQLAQEEENREKQTTPGAEITPVPGAESDISETIAEEKQEMEEQIKEFVDTPAAAEVSSETEAEISETPATETPAPTEEPTPLPPEPVPTPETGGTVQPQEPVATEEAPTTPADPNAPNPNDIAL